MLDAILACDSMSDSVSGIQATLAGLDLGDEPGDALALIGGIALAAFMVTLLTVRQIITGRAREASRREIAAYVAEGTISVEDGERLLKAGRSWGCVD